MVLGKEDKDVSPWQTGDICILVFEMPAYLVACEPSRLSHSSIQARVHASWATAGPEVWLTAFARCAPCRTRVLRESLCPWAPSTLRFGAKAIMKIPQSFCRLIGNNRAGSRKSPCSSGKEVVLHLQEHAGDTDGSPGSSDLIRAKNIAKKDGGLAISTAVQWANV